MASRGKGTNTKSQGKDSYYSSVFSAASALWYGDDPTEPPSEPVKEPPSVPVAELAAGVSLHSLPVPHVPYTGQRSASRAHQSASKSKEVRRKSLKDDDAQTIDKLQVENMSRQTAKLKAEWAKEQVEMQQTAIGAVERLTQAPQSLPELSELHHERAREKAAFQADRENFRRQMLEAQRVVAQGGAPADNERKQLQKVYAAELDSLHKQLHTWEQRHADLNAEIKFLKARDDEATAAHPHPNDRRGEVLWQARARSQAILGMRNILHQWLRGKYSGMIHTWRQGMEEACRKMLQALVTSTTGSAYSLEQAKQRYAQLHGELLEAKRQQKVLELQLEAEQQYRQNSQTGGITNHAASESSNIVVQMKEDAAMAAVVHKMELENLKAELQQCTTVEVKLRADVRSLEEQLAESKRSLQLGESKRTSSEKNDADKDEMYRALSMKLVEVRQEMEGKVTRAQAKLSQANADLNMLQQENALLCKDRDVSMQSMELSTEEKKQVSVMGAEAYKKFKELDIDNSGTLEGAEVHALAEWVWRCFHPGEHTRWRTEAMEQEAAKILHRCDKNGDGKIDEVEFERYFLQTAKAITKFRKAAPRMHIRQPGESFESSDDDNEAQEDQGAKMMAELQQALDAQAELKKQTLQLSMQQHDTQHRLAIIQNKGRLWALRQISRTLCPPAKPARLLWGLVAAWRGGVLAARAHGDMEVQQDAQRKMVEESCGDVTSQMDFAMSQMERVQVENINLKMQITSLMSEVETLSAHRMMVEEGCQDLALQRNNQVGAVKTLQDENINLKMQITSLMSEVETLSAHGCQDLRTSACSGEELEQLQQQVVALTDENTKLVDSKQLLHATCVSAQQDCEQWKAQCQDLKTDEEVLQARNDVLAAELSRLQGLHDLIENDDLTAVVKMLNASEKKLSRSLEEAGEVGELKREIERLNKDADKERACTEKSAEELALVRSDMERLSGDLEMWKKIGEGKGGGVLEAMSRAQAALQECEHWKLQHQDLQKRCKEQDAGIARLNETIPGGAMAKRTEANLETEGHNDEGFLARIGAALRGVEVEIEATHEERVTQAGLQTEQELELLDSIAHEKDAQITQMMRSERGRVALRAIQAALQGGVRVHQMRLLHNWAIRNRRALLEQRFAGERIHLEVEFTQFQKAVQVAFSVKEHRVAMRQMKRSMLRMFYNSVLQRLMTWRYNRVKGSSATQLRILTSRAQAIRKSSAIALLRLGQERIVAMECREVIMAWRLNNTLNKRQRHFAIQKALHDAALKSSAVRQLRLTLKRLVQGQVGSVVESWHMTVLEERHFMEVEFLSVAEAEARKQFQSYSAEVLRLTQRVSQLEPLEEFFTDYDTTEQRYVTYAHPHLN